MGRLLCLQGMRWAGDISYSWYLWHWPLVVMAGEALGGLNVGAGLAVVVLAAVPAHLSYRYLERPYMRWRRVAPNGRALRLGAAGMVVAALVGAGLLAVPSPGVQGPTPTIATEQSEDGRERTVELYGAEALEVDPTLGRVENAPAGFMPTGENAAEDTPEMPQEGCHVDGAVSEPRRCDYGPRDARYTVALVGDSHATHWVPALQRLTQERGLRLVSYTKSACPLSTEVIRGTQNGGQNQHCLDWGENVLAELERTQPDLVLVSSSRHTAPDGGPYASGAAAAWARIQEAGLRMGFITDVPRPDFDVPECVVVHEGDLGECAVPRDEAIANSGQSQQREALELAGDVPAVDLSAQICPEDLCSPVVGGVLLYRDSHHLTATYARTLAPELERALEAEGLLADRGR